MLKRRALMESISSNLHGFLKRIANNLSLPDKKFLRDSLVGLLRCGKPIVCQMARHLLRFSGGSQQSKVGQWVPIRARQLADQVPTPYRFDKLVKRRGRPAIRITQIGWIKVRLPGRDEVLTLVVSRLAGQAIEKCGLPSHYASADELITTPAEHWLR